MSVPMARTGPVASTTFAPLAASRSQLSLLASTEAALKHATTETCPVAPRNSCSVTAHGPFAALESHSVCWKSKLPSRNLTTLTMLTSNTALCCLRKKPNQPGGFNAGIQRRQGAGETTFYSPDPASTSLLLHCPLCPRSWAKHGLCCLLCGSRDWGAGDTAQQQCHRDSCAVIPYADNRNNLFLICNN